MNPKIISKEKMMIAGIMGDGNQTGKLWDDFDKKAKEIEIANTIGQNGYEVRFYYDNKCDCFVGSAVSDENINRALAMLVLQPSEYAVFDVIVANGYDSENKTMNDWLKDNPEKYVQSMLDGKPYVVECFNERFKEGIVEIWIPVHKN